MVDLHQNNFIFFKILKFHPEILNRKRPILYCDQKGSDKFADLLLSLTGVCNHVRLELACSATETTWSLEILDLAIIGIIQSRQRTIKVLIRLCGSTQADLRLCCSHMTSTGFFMTWLKLCVTKSKCWNTCCWWSKFPSCSSCRQRERRRKI